ncbi:uncharacterized protein TNIN_183711 [Trichonephila inaurata madagascariensis]|uniref:Uncharacterized protein n=1 Tax=Trichonephila inaurata madagascariensis TaxID=2747483 RepID=A0A8X6XXA4_9ARAC|nr:uncharacterized protein TNIN_183711 [Trichonephila inaurata madagascariensis]
MHINGRIGWIIATILFISKLASTTEKGKGLNSHKKNSMSHIPWNILLDPNYTSHKKISNMNYTFQPPSHQEIFSMDSSTLHPHHSYNINKEIPSQIQHYATPPPTQLSYSYDPQKYTVHHLSESKPQRMEIGQFSPAVPSRPMEKIVFPSNQGRQTKRPEIFQRQTFRPLQKNKITLQDVKKDEKRKQSILTDFFKGEGSLKGAQIRKTAFSATNDYYSQYPPNKHYGEPEHSYYNDDTGYVSPGYPIKNEYYGPSGYDYDSPVDEKYAGIYPYPEKRKGSKYGPLAFALGLLPLGLLLASLVPTVVTIPVTTAVATGRRRKRSVRFINPALEIISSYDMSALEDPVCMKQIFCEVVRDGKKETASIVQKFYFKLAYILDEKLVEFMGMKGLVTAVRKDKCQEFHCSTNRKLSNALPKNDTSEKNS